MGADRRAGSVLPWRTVSSASAFVLMRSAKPDAASSVRSAPEGSVVHPTALTRTAGATGVAAHVVLARVLKMCASRERACAYPPASEKSAAATAAAATAEPVKASLFARRANVPVRSSPVVTAAVFLETSVSAGSAVHPDARARSAGTMVAEAFVVSAPGPSTHASPDSVFAFRTASGRNAEATGAVGHVVRVGTLRSARTVFAHANTVPVGRSVVGQGKSATRGTAALRPAQGSSAALMAVGAPAERAPVRSTRARTVHASVRRRAPERSVAPMGVAVIVAPAARASSVLGEASVYVNHNAQVRSVARTVAEVPAVNAKVGRLVKMGSVNFFFG